MSKRDPPTREQVWNYFAFHNLQNKKLQRSFENELGKFFAFEKDNEILKKVTLVQQRAKVKQFFLMKGGNVNKTLRN